MPRKNICFGKNSVSFSFLCRHFLEKYKAVPKNKEIFEMKELPNVTPCEVIARSTYTPKTAQP